MPNNEAIIARTKEIIAARAAAGPANFCTLSGVEPDGYPASTTISIAKSDGIRWLTFCTGAGSPSTLRLRENPKACVTLNSQDYHIGLVGEAEILTDLASKQENWYSGLQNHFSGPEDENLAVIRFRTRRYSLFIDWNDVKGEI